MLPKTAVRLSLLQQWRSGRRLPLVVDKSRSASLAKGAHLLKDRDKTALAAGAETGFVSLDGEVQHADGGVLLHGEESEVTVGDLDLEHPGEG